MKESKPFVIINSRDGEDPNVLGLGKIDKYGMGIPQLAVSKDKKIPSLLESSWTLGLLSNDAYCLMIEHENTKYYLSATDIASNRVVVLVPKLPSDLSPVSWQFPESGWKIYLNGQNNLFLDAGAFPNLMLWEFAKKSTNQTWASINVGDPIVNNGPGVHPTFPLPSP